MFSLYLAGTLLIIVGLSLMALGIHYFKAGISELKTDTHFTKSCFTKYS